jgi:hypothetical protein
LEPCARPIDCPPHSADLHRIRLTGGHLAPWRASRAKEFLNANLIRTAQRMVFIESSGSCLQIFMPSLCNPYDHFHLLIGSGNDFAAGGRQRHTPQAKRSRSTSKPEADDIEIQRARIWAHTLLPFIYRNNERSKFSRPGIQYRCCRPANSPERATGSRG